MTDPVTYCSLFNIPYGLLLCNPGVVTHHANPSEVMQKDVIGC